MLLISRIIKSFVMMDWKSRVPPPHPSKMADNFDCPAEAVHSDRTIDSRIIVDIDQWS